MASFRLIGLNDAIPSQHRMATRQDVKSDKQALLKAMPGWEIANLADGSVDGASYGGNIRNDIRSDVTQKLVIYDPDTSASGSQGLSFRLFNTDDDLPPRYRLATTEDVQANREALFQAMPGWEIANLANGSVDGASYKGEVRNAARSDATQKLAVLPSPLRFQLFNNNDQIPGDYRLATVGEVESNRPALLEAMPGWEIANLANGSVDGANYGGKTRKEQRNDATQKLAVAL